MAIALEQLLRQQSGALRIQPTPKRLRARIDAVTAFDTTDGLLVWEPGRIVPTYAVPASALTGELRDREPDAVDPPTPGAVLDPRHPFDVRTTPGRAVAVTAPGADRAVHGFVPTDPDLTGYVVVDFDGFDGWLEEDEPIGSHPRDPFHRVDVRRSSRSVEVQLDGHVLASSNQAMLVFETGLPVRYYLPRVDVAVALSSTGTRTECAYKGVASYWAAHTPGGTVRDVAWSYEQPLLDAAAIAGYVAFWDERTDLILDGVARPRPTSPFS